ncbi:MAG: DUF2339 domain-containing protein [Roseovarius sp.]|uniref:DUF2339 domain-containing protein n=1 Tax=Roseovarius sp. TaxID=1486281 RepID=UPI0032EDAE05
MDILVGFLGLGSILLVLAVPYLLIAQAGLRRRVRALEKANADLRDGSVSQRTDEVTPAIPEAAPHPLSAPKAARATQARASMSEPEAATSSTVTRGQVPRAFVFRADRIAALGQWLRDNWALAVAGLSMALSGVFMVQYGVEQGLLTPVWRVIGALLLGAGLIAGGEVIRRRHGDETQGATQSLPSVLSGAGLVSLFAGVLAAHALYTLIPAGTALLGLVTVAAVAIVLGWFYGPVLAAGGIIGAAAAPFLLGGSSEAPWLFYYYFVLIALAGLAVDTVKRWAWVSALVLVVTMLAAIGLYVMGVEAAHFLVFLALLSAMALVIPERRLMPRHAGTSILGMMLGHRPLPEFPTRLGGGMVIAASVGAIVVAADAQSVVLVWLAIGLLALLLSGALWWLRGAEGLQDIALAPAIAVVFVVAEQSPYPFGPLLSAFRAPRVPESDMPLTVTVILGLAAIASLLANGRMRRAADVSAPGPAILWTIGAAMFAPGMLLMFEFLWQPAVVLGAYVWALHALALAALMTGLAMRCHRDAGPVEPALRAAIFAVAALTLIALALFLLLADSALTVALGVMVLGTTLIDRRHDLPLLGWALQAGAVIIGYRLIVDPGVFWGMDAAPVQVWLAYGGAITLLAAAWRVMAHRPQSAARVVLESAVWTLSSVFACVLLFRVMGEDRLFSHWGAGLLATVWIVSALNQLYRLKAGGGLIRAVRISLASVFGLMGLGLILLQVTLLNPIFDIFTDERVIGPPILDSLAVACLPLALAFGIAAWRLTHLPRFLRSGFVAVSAGYAAAFAALEIRRLWRGTDLSVPGVTQPELYSYTVAMLVVAVAMLLLAFARRSVGLRKLAMLGVALTVAKVFVIDTSGLSGLIRVMSFMGLGLGLAGLVWLNRKMSAQWDRAKGSS